MTEREKAMARFERELANGLVDMKFLIIDGEKLSEEEIFAAINHIDEALDSGRCQKHDTWTKDMEPVPFPPLMG
jgi:hypothetical protein